MKDKKNIIQHYNIGTVIFLDLDGFKNCTEEMNWIRWTPNPITDFLSTQIIKFIYTYQAVHIWGLNEKEGTEECILIFWKKQSSIFDLLNNLRIDILNIAMKLRAPTSLSVGIATGQINNTKPINHNRKSDFKKDPLIYLAYKALRKAKKTGGNKILIY